MKAWRNCIVGIALEGVPGVAETLTAADFAVLAYDPTLDPDIEFEDRTPSGIGFGHSEATPGQYKIGGRIRVDFKGSGTAATLPIWGRLLQTAGLVATSGTGKVDLALFTSFSELKTATIAIWRDGVKSLGRGCACDFEIVGEAGKRCYIEFTISGIFTPDTDEAAPTPITHESTLPLRTADATFTLDGASYGHVSRFRFRAGNQVELRDDIEDVSGIAHAFIADRNPMFAFDPEVVAVASDDVHGDMLASLTKPLVLQLPKTASADAGNQWILTMPTLQRTNAPKQNRKGLATYNFEAKVVGGDAAYTLTHQ